MGKRLTWKGLKEYLKTLTPEDLKEIDENYKAQGWEVDIKSATDVYNFIKGGDVGLNYDDTDTYESTVFFWRGFIRIPNPEFCTKDDPKYIQIKIPTGSRPNFPKNYEWFYDIPDKDMKWVTDVIAGITDNNQACECNGVVELASFLWYDQGTEAGIIHKYSYLAAKQLGITSEEEYLNWYDDIEKLAYSLLKEDILNRAKIF